MTKISGIVLAFPRHRIAEEVCDCNSVKKIGGLLSFSCDKSHIILRK